jgi:hypothetical protein
MRRKLFKSIFYSNWNSEELERKSKLCQILHVSYEWPNQRHMHYIMGRRLYVYSYHLKWSWLFSVHSEMFTPLRDITEQAGSRGNDCDLHFGASSLDRNIDNPDRALLWFPSLSPGWYVKTTSRPLPSTSFQIPYSVASYYSSLCTRSYWKRR